MQINIHHIFISPDHNFVGHHGKPAGTNPIESLAKTQCIAGKGLVGDRYFDLKPDFKGQITFFSFEVYQELLKETGTEHSGGPDRMRRNIIIEGADLNSLIGKTFQIGDCTFEGAEECSPCYWMDEAIGDGALKFLVNQGGLRARILTDGWLKLGETTLTIS